MIRLQQFSRRTGELPVDLPVAAKATLADSVGEFEAGECRGRGNQRSESLQWPAPRFAATVVSLDNFVDVLAGAHLHTPSPEVFSPQLSKRGSARHATFKGDATSAALQAFAEGSWGSKYSSIVQSWTRAWEHVTPSFVFSPDIRRAIYTTNTFESLNMQLHKIIKTRGQFPNDESAIKLLRLAPRNVLNKSVRGAFDWKSAMNQFAILYGDRFTVART